MGLLLVDELSGLGEPRYTGYAPGGSPAAGGSSTTTRFDPGTLARMAARRFKGLFYEQPKAWHVDRRGRETPIMRVGGGWSREGVRRAARDSEGTDLAAERRFVDHFKDAYRGGRRSPAWRSFWRMHWKRKKDINRMIRARKIAEARRDKARRAKAEKQRRARIEQDRRRRAEWKRKRGIKPYRGITPEQARRDRDDMIAWNTRLRIQREQRERKARVRTRTPAPRGGLITALGPPTAAMPTSYTAAF